MLNQNEACKRMMLTAVVAVVESLGCMDTRLTQKYQRTTDLESVP